MNTKYTPRDQMTGAVSRFNLPDEQSDSEKELAEILKAIRPFFDKEQWIKFLLPDRLTERAKAEYAICWNEFMDSPLDEAEKPVAEQVAEEAAKMDEWLGTASEMTDSAYMQADLSTYDIAVSQAEYNLKRARETGENVEWAEQRLQEEVIKRNNYFATRGK